MKFLGKELFGFWLPFVGWQYFDCDHQCEILSKQQGAMWEVKCGGVEWFGLGIWILIDQESLRYKR